MAGVSKTHSHEIVFEGALLSTTRASLVTELLQYFLYERQQIPLPIDELKLLLDKTRSHKPTAAVDSDRDNFNCGSSTFSSKYSSSSSKFRKVENLVEDLSQLSAKLTQAFEKCPEIEQVAVLFGGTVVSPKESYVIKFPPPCPDAENQSLKSCKRNLFQQVISEDFLGSLTKALAPTNVTVLISAPRLCPLQWFVPKQNLKSPKLGTIINFNFHCEYLVPICHDLTLADGEFELSGLELLDCSQCESDESNTLEENQIPGKDQENLAEAGTATGVSNVALPISSGQTEPGAVSCSSVLDNNESGEAASATPLFPRFCKHQRPNYIYSSKKYLQMRSKNNTALASVCSSDVSHQGLDTACESTHNPIEPDMKKLNLSPHSGGRDDTDCIWYQSPIVIKGLKKQDLFPGKT